MVEIWNINSLTYSYISYRFPRMRNTTQASPAMSSPTTFVILFLFSFLTSFRASAQDPTYVYHSVQTQRLSPETALTSPISEPFSLFPQRLLLYRISATSGRAPDRVTGLFLCCGDIKQEDCRSCVCRKCNLISVSERGRDDSLLGRVYAKVLEREYSLDPEHQWRIYHV